MNIYILSLFCFAFSSILLGFMIFMKRRDNMGLYYFIYCLFCGLWGIGYTFQINNDVSYGPALWSSRFADAAALFIPPAWLMFIAQFLGLEKIKKLAAFIYLISAGILITFPTGLFIPALKDKTHIGFKHFVTPGPTFHVFTIMFFIVTVYGFYLIARAYYDPQISQARKKQIGLFFIAVLLGYAGGTPAFLPVYDINFPIRYSTLIMPFYPFLTAFAITRYQLLDVEEIARVAHRDKLAAIGTLATSLNHEIRNPLYVIQGLSETLLVNLTEGVYVNSEKALEKCTEVLGKTVHQATRAMEIMKRFAVFAKQNVRQTPETQNVNLSQIVEDLLPLVGHELELDKIALTLNIPRDLSFQADLRHTEEILFNLIVNACQAMKEMGGKIEIGAERQNGHVNILINDNGPGIPHDRLNQIFEPFYTTKQEGTGLGLYVTKQLVECNGGKISVKSKLGRGTSFLLEFDR